MRSALDVKNAHSKSAHAMENGARKGTIYQKDGQFFNLSTNEFFRPMSVIFTCSIDDGHPSDIRMAELLDRHGLNGTFYVPIKNREGHDVMTPAQLRDIARRFEIGSHTLDHCYLDGVEVWEAYDQIMKGKKQLEHILGHDVTGFCYPGGKYQQREAKLVKDCGFTYARTVMNLRFDAGHRPFEIPTTIQFYPHDRSVYFRNFAKAGKWFGRHAALRIAAMHENWIERIYALFDYACSHGKVFHLWGHSWEINALDGWTEIDRFFAYVATKVAAPDRLSNKQLVDRYFCAQFNQSAA